MKNLEENLKILGFNFEDFRILNLEKLTKKKSYLCGFNHKTLVFVYRAKTRFLSKDALFLEKLLEQIFEEKLLIKSQISEKYFIYKAALCSKAKKFLEEKGFKVYALM